MNKRLISTSKFLSLVLRHQPEVIGMQLAPEGWLPINELIENANKRGTSITLELLHEVVATNDKKRAPALFCELFTVAFASACEV